MLCLKFLSSALPVMLPSFWLICLLVPLILSVNVRWKKANLLMYFPVDLVMISSVFVPLSSILNLLLQSQLAYILIWLYLTFLSLQWMLAVSIIYPVFLLVLLWFVLMLQHLQTFSFSSMNASNQIPGNYCDFQGGCCIMLF